MKITAIKEWFLPTARVVVIGGVMALKIPDYILDCGQMAAIFLRKSFI